MINIRESFLTLTKRRYPNGTENLAMDIVKSILPDREFKKDQFGNYWLYIPMSDGSDSTSMFTCHIDTIDRGPYKSYGYYDDKKWDPVLKKYVTNPDYKKPKDDDKSIVHVFDGDFVKTDGKSNLGADDKAGTVIMLNMISENVPGLYYFFIGEESGCIGSSSLSRVFEDQKDYPTKMDRCVSFDRKGYDSIITEQMSVCASNEFANELAGRLNKYGFWFGPDPTGVYTDSAEFVDVIPECTNISCGYFSEHTTSEKQDLEFLTLLAITVTQIDWETLPVVREKSTIYTGKKSSYKGSKYGSRWNDYDYDYGYGNYGSSSYGSSYKKKTTTYKSTETDFDFDKWYDEQKAKAI